MKMLFDHNFEGFSCSVNLSPAVVLTRGIWDRECSESDSAQCKIYCNKSLFYIFQNSLLYKSVVHSIDGLKF